MEKKITIAIDAMGGDNSPNKIIEGLSLFLIIELNGLKFPTKLFFGFIIFAFSNFGGTIVLGVLTSIILFVAMITNLTLLPSIILHFYKK